MLWRGTFEPKNAQNWVNRGQSLHLWSTKSTKHSIKQQKHQIFWSNTSSILPWVHLAECIFVYIHFVEAERKKKRKTFFSPLIKSKYFLLLNDPIKKIITLSPDCFAMGSAFRRSILSHIFRAPFFTFDTKFLKNWRKTKQRARWSCVKLLFPRSLGWVNALNLLKKYMYVYINCCLRWDVTDNGRFMHIHHLLPNTCKYARASIFFMSKEKMMLQKTREIRRRRGREGERGGGGEWCASGFEHSNRSACFCIFVRIFIDGTHKHKHRVRNPYIRYSPFKAQIYWF